MGRARPLHRRPAASLHRSTQRGCMLAISWPLTSSMHVTAIRVACMAASASRHHVLHASQHPPPGRALHWRPSCCSAPSGRRPPRCTQLTLSPAPCWAPGLLNPTTVQLLIISRSASAHRRLGRAQTMLSLGAKVAAAAGHAGPSAPLAGRDGPQLRQHRTGVACSIQLQQLLPALGGCVSAARSVAVLVLLWSRKTGARAAPVGMAFRTLQTRYPPPT
jgi:hypothetical protein